MNLSCLMRAEGNKREADYLFNMTYYEYYYSILDYNKYQDKVKEQYEKNKPK